MGLTLLGWTDRGAGTVTRVSLSGKTFWFREDRVTRLDSNGMSDAQTYLCDENPSAPERKAVRTKTGQWKEAGGRRLALGYRNPYYDFTF